MRPAPTIRQPPLSKQAPIPETLPHVPLWRGLLAPPRCSDQNEHGTNDSSKDQDGESDLHPDPEVTDCRLDSVPPCAAVSRNRHCQNPSKVVISESTRSSSGVCRTMSIGPFLSLSKQPRS